MRILILAVGHKMPSWVKQAWDEYAKRLPDQEIKVELKEIKAEARTSGKTPEQMMQAEVQRIQAAIPDNFDVWALDEHGKNLTTMQLSQDIKNLQDLNQNIVLIIGGPDGLDSEFKSRCRQLIRLSSLTLPHPMVRVVLIEQLYRAWSILNNHPYHRS